MILTRRQRKELAAALELFDHKDITYTIGDDLEIDFKSGYAIQLSRGRPPSFTCHQWSDDVRGNKIVRKLLISHLGNIKSCLKLLHQFLDTMHL